MEEGEPEPIGRSERLATLDAFHLALGTFVHEYSLLEQVMTMMLTSLSGVSGEVSKSIFSGVRLKTAKDQINRILDATGQIDLKSRLREHFNQIGHLNSMRDDILHYGAAYKPDLGTFVFSNDRAAHTPDKLRTFNVSPSMLDDMAHDTQKALAGVIYEICKDLNPPEALAHFRHKIAQPWRYKPPPPTPPLRENPQNPQSQPRQHGASEAKRQPKKDAP